jgi:ankyrin repeat protein
MEHGADATILNGVGRAAVHVADESECLRILLQHRGDLVNVGDAAGNTTLHYAAAAKDGGDRLAVIAALTADVVKPNAKNKVGSTPLHVAVADVSAAAALLRLGADPNEQGMVMRFSFLWHNPAVDAEALGLYEKNVRRKPRRFISFIRYVYAFSR